MGHLLKQIYRLRVLYKFVLSYLSKNKNECGTSATPIKHMRPPLGLLEKFGLKSEMFRYKVKRITQSWHQRNLLYGGGGEEVFTESGGSCNACILNERVSSNKRDL